MLSYHHIERPSLFRSKPWLDAWVRTFAHKFDQASAHKIGDLYDCAGVGIYGLVDKIFYLLPVKTLYPVGTMSRHVSAFRGEYFQFPFECESFLAWENFWNDLGKTKWDRLVVNDLVAGSDDHVQLVREAEQRGCSVMVREKEKTYGVDTHSNSFDHYLRHLGRNTRYKMFNRRTRLEALGKVELKNYIDQPDAFFKLLDGFLECRWGKGFSESQKLFIKNLLNSTVEHDIKFDFSVLTLNDVPLSAALDIHYGNRVYNLLLGYSEHDVKGLSLGTLHLGYQIEAAFNNAAISFYDLMAGRGKHSNYKMSLSNVDADFVQLMIVKNEWLAMAYKLKDQLAELKYSLAFNKSNSKVNPAQDHFQIGASDLPQIAGFVLQGLLG